MIVHPNDVASDIMNQIFEDLTDGENEIQLQEFVNEFNSKGEAVSFKLSISDMTLTDASKPGAKPKVVTIDIDLPRRELSLTVDKTYPKRPNNNFENIVNAVSNIEFDICLDTTDAVFEALRLQKTGTATLNASVVLKVLAKLTPEEIIAIDDALNNKLSAYQISFAAGRVSLITLLKTLSPTQFYIAPTYIEVAKLYILDGVL